MDIDKIALGLIEAEIREWPEMRGASPKKIEQRAKSILDVVRGAELEIERRFSELNVMIQQENVPE